MPLKTVWIEFSDYHTKRYQTTEITGTRNSPQGLNNLYSDYTKFVCDFEIPLKGVRCMSSRREQHVNLRNFYDWSLESIFTFQSLCWDTTVQAETRRDLGQCRHSRRPA